jgi:hypothetical protein
VRVRTEGSPAKQQLPAPTPTEALAAAEAPVETPAVQPIPVAATASAAPAAPHAFEAMMINAPVRNNVPFAVNGRLAQLGVVGHRLRDLYPPVRR